MEDQKPIEVQDVAPVGQNALAPDEQGPADMPTPIVEDKTPPKTCKDRLKRIALWFFPPKAPTENLIQYLFRQLYFPDSRGRPSITVTILIYVLALVGCVAFVECHNAMIIAITKITDAAGKTTITTAPYGFSVTFLTMVIGLTALITGWYRQRQSKAGEPGENGDINDFIFSKVKEYVTSLIGKK